MLFRSDLVGHFAAGRFEMTRAASHQSFRQGEDATLEFEQVCHCIVVLKPVHASDRDGGEVVLRERSLEERLKVTDHPLTCSGFERGFLFRWHFLLGQGRNYILDQLGAVQQVRVISQSEQVHFPFYFALLAVAFDAMHLERGLEGRSE